MKIQAQCGTLAGSFKILEDSYIGAKSDDAKNSSSNSTSSPDGILTLALDCGSSRRRLSNATTPQVANATTSQLEGNMKFRTDGGEKVPFQLSVNAGKKMDINIGDKPETGKFQERSFSISHPGSGEHTFQVWQNDQDVYLEWVELTTPNTTCKLGVKGNFS